jgi:5'-3' exonuclease
MDSPRPTLMVLDSPSIVYRAFFALPKSITGPDGASVNAVRGYLDMFSRLLVDHRPEAVLHVLDADWRPQWRVDAWPGYKASRRDDPPELPGQVPVLRTVLEAAGLPVAEAEGYEADDVIGTVAAAAGPDERLAVVTGDRDLLQVVRDPVAWVLFPVKGTSQLTRFDEATVTARYSVPPSRYVDYATLRGDPSDGLPGIPGVGEKTAARLVSQFATLDELVAGRDGLGPRLSAALGASAEYLAAMRRIVPVATDVAWTATPPHPPDGERLDALAAAHGLDGPIRRLRAALAGAGLAPPAEPAGT